MKTKELIIFILAFLALADCMVLSVRSNVTAGLVCLYLLTIGLFLYGRFYGPIDTFCSHGIGFVFKILFFIGFAFFLFLCFLMAQNAQNTATGKEKAVIILGAGLHGEELSDTLKRRLDKALQTYTDNHDIIFVVSGGQGPQESCTEASAMAKYLQQNGISSNRILLEDLSVSTQTNFIFSLSLLEKAGVSKSDLIAFVTNDFHCYRSKAYAQMAGYENTSHIAATTSLWVLPSAVIREVLAICALWAKSF